MPKLPNVEQELTSKNFKSFKTANEKILLENMYKSFLDFLVSKYTNIKILAYLFRMLSLYFTIKCEKEHFLFDFLMVQTERIMGDNSSNHEKMIYHLDYMLNNENKERLQWLKVDSQPITSTINKFTFFIKIKKNKNSKNLVIQKQSQKFKQIIQKVVKDKNEIEKDTSKKEGGNLDSFNSQNNKNDSKIKRLKATEDLYKNKLQEILVNLIDNKNENTQFDTVIEYIDKLNETIMQKLLKDNHLQVQIEDLNLEIVTKETNNTGLENTNKQLQNQLKQQKIEDQKNKELINDLESQLSEMKVRRINTS